MKAIDKERLINIIKHIAKDGELIWEDTIVRIYALYADDYFLEDKKKAKEVPNHDETS